MQSATLPDTPRRSSRVPAAVPILVTSLEPGAQFSEVCETLVVNAHGCALRSPVKLSAGARMQFHSKDGRETTAQVVDCQPIGADQTGWRLGATLQRPENFWGLKACPEDWSVLPGKRLAAAGKAQATNQPQNQTEPSARVVLTKEHLRSIVAEFIQPLHAELTSLREKLAGGEAKRGRLEISLAQIPPELEEQMWKRLHENLGPRVLNYTREQSEQVLGSAKTAIDKKITEAQDEFRQRLAVDLHGVEQRAQALSDDLGNTVREHLRSGVKRFERQVEDGGTRLEARSEELLLALQQRLSEYHDAHYRELQEIQGAMDSQSTQLQSQIAELGSRVALLDGTARRLEADLDDRLTRVTRDVVSAAHAELQQASETILHQMETRHAKELGDRLDDACGRLQIVQKGIEASVSESLRSQLGESLRCFEQKVEEVALHSVERWRRALARDLSSLGKMLGEQFQLDAASDRNESH
jgi:gas vesicle protein